MDVNRLIFRGDTQAPGTWYGRVETQGDQTRALVLFKRRVERSDAQHLADKVKDVHKGGKLASELIAGNVITIQSDVTNKDVLQRYLQAATQNDHTLDMISSLLRSQSAANIGPTGKVNLVASLRAVNQPGVGAAHPLHISLEP